MEITDNKIRGYVTRYDILGEKRDPKKFERGLKWMVENGIENITLKNRHESKGGIPIGSAKTSELKADESGIYAEFSLSVSPEGQAAKADIESGVLNDFSTEEVVFDEMIVFDAVALVPQGASIGSKIENEIALRKEQEDARRAEIRKRILFY
jgi:phage head maturation protease